MRYLSGSQARQLADCEQVYEALRHAETNDRRRFSGAMSWKTVGGRNYLYRKTGQIWRSLGPRSPETEQIHDGFHEGRAASKARRKTLNDEIRAMAPVNVAMRLGRVPHMSARILRRLDREGLLGHGFRVAGTHALYAYERLAGGHFHADIVSTLDIDLLHDARSRLRLTSSDLANDGLLGLLKSLDSSFALTEPGSFRAANGTGFLVDLIRPMPRNPSTARTAPVFGSAEDLRPAEILGLEWLQNNPAIEATVIDEKGYPLSITAPDPRVFAIHKLWVSQRNDRDWIKRRRDAAQAAAVAEMLVKHLPHLTFDDRALNLPADIRKLGQALSDDALASQAQALSESAEDWA